MFSTSHSDPVMMGTVVIELWILEVGVVISTSIDVARSCADCDSCIDHHQHRHRTEFIMRLLQTNVRT